MWNVVTRKEPNVKIGGPAQKKEMCGCKWVFTIKYKVNETIKRYKARLVIKDYTQIYKIDYEEIFAPVSKNTMQVLLS